MDKTKKSFDLLKNNANILQVVLPFLKKIREPEQASPIEDEKSKNAISGDNQIVSIEERRKNEKSKTKVQKVPLNFYRCITMFGVPFNYQDRERTVWDISSMKEDKIQKLFESSPEKIQVYHKRNLSRVYPSPFRTDSSNFDPTISWAAGVQYVALNYQTPDVYMLMNLSKFQQNGGVRCGYLLKPEYMLNDSKNIVIPKKYSIKIDVLSAQQLKLPEKLKDKKEKIKNTIDPYVVVYLKGLPEDEKRNKIYKSPHVVNNGFNPCFQNFFCEFEVLKSEFAFLVFEVWNKNKLKDERIGWNAVPVEVMAQGYRTVPLRDPNLDIIEFCYLFCKVQFSITLI